MTRTAILGLLITAALTLAIPLFGSDSDGTIILNERSYWRHYYVRGMMRLDAEELKNAKSEWFPEKVMKRIEKGTQKLLKKQNIDWSKTDWRDKCVVSFARNLDDNPEAMQILPTIYPDKQWAEQGFDDGDWVRQQFAPLPHGRAAVSFHACYNRAMYLRSYFMVPDPAKADKLLLNIIYRGGIRVLVNGKELKRAHLPEGELKPGTKAESYPEEAYRARREEVPHPNKGVRHIPDLRFAFEKAPKPRIRDEKMKAFRDTGGHGELLNQQGWERIKKLRDRELKVEIPGNLLKKGSNVIALEIHGSHYHPIIMPRTGGNRFYQAGWSPHGATSNYSWAHCRLIRMELTDPKNAVPAATARPEGIQVWVEDMHNRLYPQDYQQPGSPMGTIRIVGGLNGSYSAQVVVGTSKELNGLKAVMSDLKHAGGGTSIPAASATIGYMVAQPLSRLGELGYGRGIGCRPHNAASGETTLYLSRLKAVLRADNRRTVSAEMKKFSFFDHIGVKPPEAVPAGTCQPLWLSLKVPEGTAAGNYTGEISIEAEGMAPVKVPLEAQVIPWRVPSPGEFQTDSVFEQSPYALARYYKTPLFSRRHWRLIESSFKHLARTGLDTLYIPVIKRTEFGNVEDTSMIKWIRKKDGSIAFDYSVLDQYLELAQKYIGKPKVVSFTIMHWMRASAPVAVTIHDEKNAKDETLALGWKENPFDRIPLWKHFAVSLVEHMKKKGLEDSIYWGHGGDHESDPGLIVMLTELFPDIYWTAAPHCYNGGAGGGGHDRNIFRCVSEIYAKAYTDVTSYGWFRKDEKFINPLCPRNIMSGMSAPFPFRVAVDQALHLGHTGVGRMGFDYFSYGWMQGYIGSEMYVPGLPIHTLSWPGKRRVESCARYEALIEGIQGGELRIFLEQQIKRGTIPKDLADEAMRVIIDRYRATIVRKFGDSQIKEYTTGWLDRSKDVYETAAKVAQKIGLDVNRLQITTPLPELGEKNLSVRIRNWTGKERAWKAESKVPWITLQATEGSVSGQHELKLTLDGSTLKAGNTAEGDVVVTDTATGGTSSVKIIANVTVPMELFAEHPNFNVYAGKTEEREFRVLNYAKTPQKWSITSSVPWIKAEPASGTLEPNASVFIKMTAAPADKEAAIHDSVLTFKGATVNDDFKVKTYVIKPSPLPEKLPLGRVIQIETLDKGLIKSHKINANGDPLARWVTSARYETGKRSAKKAQKVHKPIFGRYRGNGPRRIILLVGRRKFERALWVHPHHETVFNLEGSGIHAFSANVGIPVDVVRWSIRQHHRKAIFEVYVDGKLKFQTNLMTTRDGAFPIVVQGLEGAKELKLLARLDSGRDSNKFMMVWADTNFYKKEDMPK